MGANTVEVVFGPGATAISRYVDILANRGIEWGLIGPREADRLWERHVFNSAAVAQLPAYGTRVLDVGSGAGLPGIPLAIARPDLTVVLLEPLLRRANFLNEVVSELGLGERVFVVRGRAEELLDHFDVVTARAVAPLSRLIEWTKHLFLPGGELLALKGRSASEEVEASVKVLRETGTTAEVLAVRVAGGLDLTYVVRVRSGSVSRETSQVR